MLLSVKKRQQYLKELGFYKGKIDGIAGKQTKQAYKDLQSAYFTRRKDVDGVYGKNTDILLRSAYNCRDLKYFKLTEFKCQCKTKYCTGYPVELNRDLLLYLDDLRNDYGKSITITSGLRCKIHNKNEGGATGSRHTTGKAADIYMYGGQSDTHKGRKELVDYWVTNYKNARYAYCNGYARTKSGRSYPTANGMGNSTHLDVK